MPTRSPTWHRSLPTVSLASLVVVAVLYIAKPVIIPLALALLLTFVLAPMVASVQKSGLKRVYAVLLTALLAFAAVVGVGWVVARQVTALAAEIPKHEREIRAKVDKLRESGAGPFGDLIKMAQDLTEGSPAAAHGDATTDSEKPPESFRQPIVPTQPKESAVARMLESVIQIVEPVASASLIVILVIFMLLNREDMRDRLLGLVGHGRVSGTTRAMEDAAGRVGKYLLTLLAANVVFGMLFGIGLWVIGVPFAFLWGFLAAVLKFIPFLGTWAAAAFPLLVSFALAPDWVQPLEVFGFFVLLDLVAANVVEPLVFGHGTGVSPIALLVAAAFWAWIWGPIGLLLATPLTVCLVVLGQHVPRLRFLALLLGNAPALPPPARLYQRLFARDKKEAGERVDEFTAQFGIESAFDEMVIPALGIARRDREHGHITADAESFILTAVREIITETAAKEGNSGAGTAAVVVACPAHHPAEEPTLDMLATLLRIDGVSVDALSARNLPSDVISRVSEVKPSAVFISVLPPGGLPQAAYLCRLLRKRFPTLKIVVGRWGSERNFDKLLVRMRKAGASYVTTSLQQCRTQLRYIADVPQPLADQDGLLHSSVNGEERK